MEKILGIISRDQYVRRKRHATQALELTIHSDSSGGGHVFGTMAKY